MSARRLHLGCWLDAKSPTPKAVAFVRGAGPWPVDLSRCGVALAGASAAQARTLLQAGAARVYVGDAALEDSTLVERLVREFGAARVGVWVAARRLPVSWTLDTVSNADFRTLTPSMPDPCWEAVCSDGTRSGTRVEWWLGQMFARGASSALVSALMGPDHAGDLNICAELTDRYGARLWFTPADGAGVALADWVRYGHIERLVLPRSAWDDAALFDALARADDALAQLADAA